MRVLLHLTATKDLGYNASYVRSQAKENPQNVQHVPVLFLLKLI
ncbi:predicted protein [Plenodomus lingam JN3]|uniref:Predicted protein n=1 Tax=Leptosphaeria maculans (strain JN3 / isolate v23.1.3 / race Av1-4-5-6-7-8) TaxID=985895 RepID=E4ZJ51_LEPMJ|nr:predicted protein [Plenodomus lingam JN3]CBX91482.1 predicted protein [Plenodomus lingam JN3]